MDSRPHEENKVKELGDGKKGTNSMHGDNHWVFLLQLDFKCFQKVVLNLV
jgi:hypothetical protein